VASFLAVSRCAELPSRRCSYKEDAVRYSDLLTLTRDAGGRVPMEALKILNLPVPDDVLEQFCSDHATNNDFQEQYGHVDLLRVHWSLQSLAASELLMTSIYYHFRRWPESVACRLASFDDDGWECIDDRSAVVEHWRSRHTWLRPPILLDGDLLGRPGSRHLVEGHTRLGLLRGLVAHRIVSADSKHEVWFGAMP
jgi:hypothetical protein